MNVTNSEYRGSTLPRMRRRCRRTRAGHVHRIEDARAAGEVVDVVVAAVLAGGHCAGAVAGDGGERVAGGGATERVLLERRQRQGRHAVGGGGDERALPEVPAGQQLGRRRGAEQARGGDPCELDAGDVPRGALLPGEVPDRLVRVGEPVGEEAAAVGFREDPGVAPALARRVTDLLRNGAEVEDVDDEQVAGLRALDGDRADSIWT